ncbi:MAG: patatin [Hyphomicrobiales bacterium]|nr:MAG: patatin [Hyphomicrobiales bacterium]
MSKTPKISLALGGGGARGLAHIVVLEALDDLGVRPTSIAGTSIGAIMGAAYAGGLSGRDIRDITLQRFSNRAKVVQLLWQMRGKRKLPKLSITDIDPLAVLESFIGDLIPASFEELQIPLCVIASDFYGWRETIMRSGDLHRAVAASIAIPILFTPVTIDGRVLIDGGFVNPLPFDRVENGNITIAVDVTGGPQEPAMQSGSDIPLPGMREMVFGTTQLVMQSITNEKLKSRTPDILIRPPIEQFGVLEFLKVKEILEAAESERDNIKRQITYELDRL